MSSNQRAGRELGTTHTGSTRTAQRGWEGKHGDGAVAATEEGPTEMCHCRRGREHRADVSPHSTLLDAPLTATREEATNRPSTPLSSHVSGSRLATLTSLSTPMWLTFNHCSLKTRWLTKDLTRRSEKHVQFTASAEPQRSNRERSSDSRAAKSAETPVERLPHRK